MVRRPNSDRVLRSVRRRAFFVTIVMPCMLLGLSLLVNPHRVLAETFTVDTFEDVVDADPGIGGCNDGESRCSLRAAIQEANASACR